MSSERIFFGEKEEGHSMKDIVMLEPVLMCT